MQVFFPKILITVRFLLNLSVVPIRITLSRKFGKKFKTTQKRAVLPVLIFLLKMAMNAIFVQKLNLALSGWRVRHCRNLAKFVSLLKTS